MAELKFGPTYTQSRYAHTESYFPRRAMCMDGRADRLRRGYGGPPKRSAKAEARPYEDVSVERATRSTLISNSSHTSMTSATMSFCAWERPVARKRPSRS